MQLPKTAQTFDRTSTNACQSTIAPQADFGTCDVELAASIRRKFTELGYPQMRQLRIDVRHGSVALSGKLSRYYLLQLAQSAVLQTPGVSKLITTVNVVPVAADPQLAAG